MQTFEANHAVGEVVRFNGAKRNGEPNGTRSLRKISGIRIEMTDAESYQVLYKLEDGRGWWPETRFEKSEFVESEESPEPDSA